MVKAVFVAETTALPSVLLLLSALVTHDQAAAGDTGEEYEIDVTLSSYLYAEKDGRICVGRYGKPHLGMVGHFGGRLEYRLSAELATKLAPLVNRPREPVDREEERRTFSFIARIRVCLVTRARLIEGPASGWEEVFDDDLAVSLRRGDQTFEIVSARLLHAELLPPEWPAAWARLDQALHEIASASLTAPTEEKRARLLEAIEKGSAALNAMAKAKAGEDFPTLVHKIDPRARVVSRFRRLEPARWEKELRDYVTRLRVNPKTALPPAPFDLDYPTRLEMLAASESAGALLAKIRESCPPETLEAGILYSGDLHRLVYFWELEDMLPERFAALRKEAQGRIEERKRRAESEKPASPKGTAVISWLRARVRMVNADEMAEKLILSGIVIERLLPHASNAGLKVGDIILNYKIVYDLVTGAKDSKRALKQFARSRRLSLRVLRGSEVLTVKPRGR